MIEDVNRRLRAGKVGVTLEQRGNRLYMVATLPPKPGSGRVRPYQQRIALGINANPAGFKAAELEAKRLGVKLAEGSFSWKPRPQDLTIGEALELFERDYLAERKGNPKAPNTLRVYQQSLIWLPKDNRLTADILIETIQARTTPNTRMRQAMCGAVGLLAKHFDLELDLSHLKGNYSSRSVNPRQLPSDAEIERIHNSLDGNWQWIFGMMATFGLRNHECFFLDHNVLVNQGICLVLEGKTTEGKVWPLYPEWLDLFNLKDIRVPNITGKNHSVYGHRVTNAFRRLGIPFSPYALRHCWARRAIELGLDSRLAAKQMRHSHSVHVKTYNAWLDDSVHQKAFEQIKNRQTNPATKTGRKYHI